MSLDIRFLIEVLPKIPNIVLKIAVCSQQSNIL